jgi:O-antigen ligase
LFFVVAILSSLINFQTFSMFDTMRSFSYLFHFLELILVFSIILMKTTFRERDWFIGIIIVFSLGELLVVGYQFFLKWLSGTYTGHFRDISGLFAHHNQVGNMMTISISCVIFRLLAAKSMRNKIVYLMLSLLFCWAIICSGARSNLLGIVSAIGVLILSQIKLSKTYFIILMSVLLISISLMLFSPIIQLIDITLNSSGSGVDMSSYNRLFIWKGAWEQFVKAPFITKVFGIGIGNFTNLHYSFLLETGKKATSGAHNNFLHVLTETGIAGFLTFISFFISAIVLLWKKGKKDTFAFCYIWVTLALLMSGSTQETFWFQPSFGNFWLYYMIVLALALIKKPDQYGSPEIPKTGNVLGAR